MNRILLFVILLLATILYSYRLNEWMPLISDQGWFYLSARDLAAYGQIPLMGIASSHPWLHQGAHWTYMLATVLWLFNSNPLAGGYLSVGIGLCTILLLYKAASDIFSSRVALIASFLYTTSALIILHTRMPYHTSPIPLYTILFFYSLWKVVQGKGVWLSVNILSLALLYNVELATLPFVSILFAVLLYGFIKKQTWTKKLKNKKVVLLSLFAFVIPMLPVFIYDFQNNFPQTVKFAAWVGYKVLVVLGYPPLHPEIETPSWNSVFSFIAENFQKLIFVGSGLVSFVIFLLSFVFFFGQVFTQLKKKKYHTGFILLSLILTIPLLAYFIARTPSEAYLPMLFPSVILVTALWLDSLMRNRLQTGVIIIILLLIGIGNCIVVFKHDYFTKQRPYTYTQRLDAAKQIVSEAEGKRYTIKGVGEGSKFESFTMNYQYLLWWLGNEPTKEAQKLQFTISEEKDKIRVTKQEKL